MLATYDTFLGEDDGPESYEKIFTYTLSERSYVSDSEVTLYYTKSVYEGGKSAARGLFVNTATVKDGKLVFDAKAEIKVLETAPSAYFPLVGDKGILATNNSKVYLIATADANGDGVADNSGYTDANLIIDAGESVTVQAVIDGYVYYTDSDGALYRINLVAGEGDSSNVRTVIASGVKTDALALDFADNRIVWFNEDDYSYVYYLDLGAASDGFEGKMMGVMTDADAEAKAEAEEEE